MRWLWLLALIACSAPTLWAQPGDAVTPTTVAPDPRQSTTSQTSAPPAALLLDAGDLVEIRVFDTPELSGKFRVDTKGEIVLPIGGAVTATRLSAEQLQTAIERQFRKKHILRNPHVEVFVLEYATQGVTVVGEVRSPGVYPIIGKRGVLDLISVAGGLTASASKNGFLTHKDSGNQSITVDLASAPTNNSQPDVIVGPGDRIVVPRAGLVYVVGDVGRPGGYLIENKETTITVLQALALAQGVNKTAKLDAKLIRNTPSGRTEADLPLKKILANQTADPTLQDGDILFVPISGTKEWVDKGVTSILQMAVGVVIYGRL